MDEVNTVVNYNWTYWVAGAFALWQAFKGAVNSFDWLFDKFGIETKRMRKRREQEERLANAEAAIVEIKNTSKTNVEMFLEHEQNVVGKFTGIKDEIVEELAKLHDKMDGQRETDLVILRDRIASGLRYFSQNKDENGNVHISFSDYENMEALFRQYFVKGGNGAFKKAYETEFRQFIIDR